MRHLIRLLGILLLTLAAWAPAHAQAQGQLAGRVTNSLGQGLCAMVLINGQYMFSCDGQGSYELSFPLDANGQATVFAFVDGLAPFRQVVTPPPGGGVLDILVGPSIGEPDPHVALQYVAVQPDGSVQLTGQVLTAGGVPLCAMVLANGQYTFSCDGQGSFDLTVPREADGSVTLFAFVDGFAPYRSTFTPAAGPTPPASTAEGLWLGSTSTGRALTGLILDDGRFYFLYSLAGSPSLIGGVVQGNGSSSGGTFSSANAREFSIEFGDVIDVGLTASFVPRQSLNGSVSAFGQSVSFTASYDASYDTTATAAAVAGSYIGQVASSAGVESASVTITLAGAVTAQGISGCQVSGTIVPRPRGNAYDVSLQFGAAPCAFPGQAYGGAAYYDNATRRLYVAAPNAARSDGVLFVGLK